MNVACAVSSMSGEYRKWFKDLSIIEHENNTPSNLNLLILTGGGADISPERYREGYNGASGVNLERDEREFNILGEVLHKNPEVRVLGVCRGLQVINVYFGGTLYQDLSSVGSSHGMVHNLVYDDRTPFSWLTKVNSLHHQAVRKLGANGSFYPYVLAKEPITSIPEIVIFGNNLLGVQFHPEMFTDCIGSRFFSIINDWVYGNISLFDNNPGEETLGEEDTEEENREEETPNEDLHNRLARLRNMYGVMPIDNTFTPIDTSTIDGSNRTTIRLERT